jgi:hypothetical protein
MHPALNAATGRKLSCSKTPQMQPYDPYPQIEWRDSIYLQKEPCCVLSSEIK